jgi:hypothetical protein
MAGGVDDRKSRWTRGGVDKVLYNDIDPEIAMWVGTKPYPLPMSKGILSLGYIISWSLPVLPNIRGKASCLNG